MVVINNNSENQILKTNRFQENIQNFTSGKDLITEKSFDLKNDIEMEGKSILIVELK
jgi:hypothetical protein